ncbi:hypothetical protein SAMN04488689_101142 [Paenibacillus sp. cl6col]|uniref:XkdQ/YqbQ family protein n=1 Tax=Paenibacillus sp. cl6col TaxID=1761878 RepID=UPI000883F3BA|nr:hypothetical protein [Paenibacillus sp. cl6col]SDE33878.1 hypothetical protein SAMN04488689_101142 [Paenibacillus sp. cl6col]
MNRLEVLVDNRNGNAWDMSQLISSMTWSTSRVGKPASISISFSKGAIFQDSFTINNGDIIRVQEDGVPVFYGYVFSIETDESNTVKLTAYDQMRYLMVNDWCMLKNVTATEIIRYIAKKFDIKLGELVDTKYKIPTFMEDNKKLLDMMFRALDFTLNSTKIIYVLYDDFGKLTLREAKSWMPDYGIGEESQMTSISYKASIDDGTYNYIKMYRDNPEKGVRETFISKDSNNMAKWGHLQLYKKIDDKMNQAQIQQLGDNLLKLHNHEKKTIKVNAVGDVRIRAGMNIPIFAPEQNVNLRNKLIEECSQEWSGSGHTMSLTLKEI